MILFKKIRWKNLLSTGNVFTEIDLRSKDMTLIIGQNGAGKSTILDALSFVLFGKPFRKINKPQLINSITQKHLIVEIEFSIGVNDYKIVRGMKPNVFEVYQNETLLNQSAEMKDYQSVLEKQILKVNHKTFNQVVILGSATFQPFMQLSTPARREVIEDILDLQIFTTMNALLKNRVTRNTEDLIRCQAEVKIVEEKIKLTVEHMDKLNRDLEETIEAKESQLSSMEEKIMELVDRQLDLVGEKEELEETIYDRANVEKKIKEMASLKHKIEANLNLLKKEVSFFEQNDDCPTCKQVISPEFKAERIDEKNIEIEKIKEGLTQFGVKYDETAARLEAINSIIDKINTIRMDIKLTDVKLDGLYNQQREIQSEIEELRDKAQRETDTKILNFEDELIEVTNRFNKLSEEKNILHFAGTLLKDGGIKARIIKQYIPVINKLINKYLSAMDFFVSFELDENFNETIKSRHRDDFTYASFSEGEKQKIDLALLFTWRAIAKLRNSVSTNLLIMDEVFDSSLDQNAVDYLMNIIYDVAKDSNIFVISHKEQMNERFSNVVKFVKYKNFSQLVE